MPTRWKVAVGAEQTAAVLEQPTAGESGAFFVCAHGAGGNMDDRGMLQLGNELRARGVAAVRFNFMYKEKKSGRPDPMPRLRECFAAVIAHTLGEVQPGQLLIGGRSMGAELVPARPDGEGTDRREDALGHALGRRRGPQIPCAEVVGTDGCPGAGGSWIDDAVPGGRPSSSA